MSKIILDLCGGTGAWSRPYEKAGYDVRVITHPERDVREVEYMGEEVHGVLAAPPCTHFSSSGARWWAEKDEDGRTLENLAVVDACMRIIHVHKPRWWCLENPVGRLRNWIGPPKAYFHPYEYGDPWTKKTCLWGKFTMPPKDPVDPTSDWVHQLSPVARSPLSTEQEVPQEYREILADYNGEIDRATIRSITPPGFARAFYEHNK